MGEVTVLDDKRREMYPDSDEARAEYAKRADLERMANEIDLAKHFAETVDSSWAAASRDERDRLLELARAALAWGVTPPIEQQNRFPDGYRAGWQAAVKEIKKTIGAIRPPVDDIPTERNTP